MQFTVSLKQNHVFRRLYAKGKSQVTSQVVLYARPNGTKSSRFGITAGTKLGHAVARNRVRRRLREIYRTNEHLLRPGYDVVVVARVRAVYARYDELERSFLKAAQALGLLLEGGEQP